MFWLPLQIQQLCLCLRKIEQWLVRTISVAGIVIPAFSQNGTREVSLLRHKSLKQSILHPKSVIAGVQLPAQTKSLNKTNLRDIPSPSSEASHSPFFVFLSA
jgi:hypothetical protein